ncbi:MAG: YtfJ family protein [Oligoflexales bacterium]
MIRNKIIVFCCALASKIVFATLPINQTPPQIKLGKDAGGRIDGKAWDSKDLQGKVHLLVYSAPGSKDLNNKATEAVKKEKFPRDKFASVAVVNMAASWLPNSWINSAIKSKQEKYPDTIYVKDINKSLVKNWDLKDDSNDIVLFNKQGEVIFSFDGELQEKDIIKLVELAKKSIFEEPNAAPNS